MKIHPITLKKIDQGHPWITKDEFSEKWVSVAGLLKLYHPSSKKFLGTFLHDPKHPKVIARFWSHEENEHFNKSLLSRISEAIQKRSPHFNKRDNIFLCFGEGDQLPGLFIQKLGIHLLIQFQAFFWESFSDQLIDIFKDKAQTLEIHHIWIQKRLPGDQKSPPKIVWGKEKTSEVISEGAIKFNLKFNLGHDIGIYTDMASLRESFFPLFKNSKSLLNLFSYTGAFSLMGLSNNIPVTSVDLSKTYMNWLLENISLNEFDPNLHQAKITNCQKALKELADNNQSFDLLVCDPPSAFTDGKKRENALTFYQKNLLSMLKLLNPKGHAVIVLNTYNISWKKFKSTLLELLKNQPEFKIDSEVHLSKDCPTFKEFPEGDYLKSFIIKRNT